MTSLRDDIPEHQPSPSTTEFQIPQAPEGPFCVFGTVFCRPHLADRLEELYRQTTYLALNEEPGTIYYCIARDPEQRHIFHFFERYTGQEAFEKHNSSDVVKMIFKEDCFEKVEARFVTAIEPMDPNIMVMASAKREKTLP